jgi:hypothetical protein
MTPRGNKQAAANPQDLDAEAKCLRQPASCVSVFPARLAIPKYVGTERRKCRLCCRYPTAACCFL